MVSHVKFTVYVSYVNDVERVTFANLCLFYTSTQNTSAVFLDNEMSLDKSSICFSTDPEIKYRACVYFCSVNVKSFKVNIFCMLGLFLFHTNLQYKI